MKCSDLFAEISRAAAFSTDCMQSVQKVRRDTDKDRVTVVDLARNKVSKTLGVQERRTLCMSDAITLHYIKALSLRYLQIGLLKPKMLQLSNSVLHCP